MKNILLLCCFALLAGTSPAQHQKKGPANNDFFVLHNVIRGDSTYKTLDEQVALIKSAGYDGVEINSLDLFDGMKAALDKQQFTGAYLYARINLDAPALDPRIETDIRALSGSKTIIAPYFVSDGKRFTPSSGTADTLVVRHLTQIGKWAKAAGLPVAVYPHVAFYVERAEHALSLVQQVNQPNVGLSFNLCHWLATRPANQTDWRAVLTTLKPRLKMITICGANDVPATGLANQPGGYWSQFILPLGTGSFDTAELVRYAVQDIGFRGPIGVQFYAMKGDKPTNLRHAMTIWQRWKPRLEHR